MELIKQLRELTGAGMVDCQKALKEANNDLEKAVEILRKSGIAKAAKRSGREVRDGVIKVALNANKTEGYMVEVNSETDFVARNEKFQAFAAAVLELIKQAQPANVEELLTLKMADATVSDSLDALSGTTGEKMAIKRLAIIKGATVAAYSHLGGKIGVLVALDQAGKEALAQEITMQVAAANPKYITPSEVDPGELAKEKEIYKEQLVKEGKPVEIAEKIIMGKMGKFYADVCLEEQEYIKDEKKKVKDVLAGVKVSVFVRFAL